MPLEGNHPNFFSIDLKTLIYFFSPVTNNITIFFSFVQKEITSDACKTQSNIHME
jgi:hypothetical protein